MVCDSTIFILFAAFFIEANLNYIIEQLNKYDEMLDFLYGKKRRGEKHPGLQDKLSWFYNQYIEKSKTANKTQMRANGIVSKLTEKLSGFDTIYRFRNDVCHGKINLSIANRTNAEKLRKQAKDIVNELYDIADNRVGRKIPRNVTYKNAIAF
jgi:hypothetical protein